MKLRALLCIVGLLGAGAVAGSVLTRLHKPAVVTFAHVGPEQSDTCTVLIHGLVRTGASMARLAEHLADAGHAVVIADYPSRRFPIIELAAMTIAPAFEACRDRAAQTLNVVTHSLGGILLRQHLLEHTEPALGRVVMLAPPNQGSEIPDALGSLPGYRWINGPAGLELGTDENAVPLRLGPTTADLAVIAGTRSINLILSQWLPNPDDGKVSVERARLAGMCAFLTAPVSHPYIMQDEGVMNEVLHYLAEGRFASPEAEYPACPANSSAAD